MRVSVRSKRTVSVDVIVPSMFEYRPLTISRLNLRSVISLVASSSEASGRMLRGLPMSWHTWFGFGCGPGSRLAFGSWARLRASAGRGHGLGFGLGLGLARGARSRTPSRPVSP